MAEREGDKLDRSTGDDHIQYSVSRVYRKVSVKGSEGVSATLIIKAERGKVRLSIEPPFTWEAIMEPSKVDEVIRTLRQAAEDVKRMVDGTD